MRRTLVYFLFLFVLSANAHADDTRQIKDALLKYNYGIIKMGQTGKTDFFKPFVKEDVVTKLMLWVKAWQDSGITMLADINDFVFDPIEFGEDNATVTTMENWTFRYVDLQTKKLIQDPITIFYSMQYTLQKQKGDWVIVDITHLFEKRFDAPHSKPSEDSNSSTKVLMPTLK